MRDIPRSASAVFFGRTLMPSFILSRRELKRDLKTGPLVFGFLSGTNRSLAHLAIVFNDLIITSLAAPAAIFE